MAIASAHGARNHATRMDGATMGERISETIERGLCRVETLQGELDTYTEQRIPVPDYLIVQYQNAVDSLERFASYWGFEC